MNPPAIRALSLVVSGIVIAAHATFLAYIVKLERTPECLCASHPYLSLVKYWSIFMIGFVALSAFGFLERDFLAPYVRPYAMALGAIVSIGSIAVYYLALRWIAVQVQIGCQCSEELRRDIMWWWSMLYLATAVVATLTPFVLTLLAATGIDTVPAKIPLVADATEVVKGAAKRVADAAKKHTPIGRNAVDDIVALTRRVRTGPAASRPAKRA